MSIAGRVPDLKSLATLLGLSPQRIFPFVKEPDKYYKSYDVVKKSGGKRSIHIPCLELKGIQRLLLANVLYEFPAHENAYGFVRNRSTRAAALIHSGSRMLVKMDIMNFFPTISEKRVFGLLNKRLGFTTKCSYVISRLLTQGGVLPQGAPTSPHIANLILFPFDEFLRLKSLKLGCAYTRYADDIAISSPAGSDAALHFLKAVPYQLKNHGFKLNDSKTVVRRANSARQYLGINISSQTIVPNRRIKRNLRTSAHRAMTDSSFGNKDFEKFQGLLEYYGQIAGRDFHYRQAKGAVRARLESSLNKEHSPFELT